jgi:P27 family predicted phage terminase small subunit
MMGRKKIPSNMHVLKGTDRADRRNENEPKPEIKIPPAPNHLSKEALIEWGRITPSLYAMGLLSDLDMASLAAYCQSYSRWVEAETELKASGLLIKTSNGNVIQNPLVGIANQAMEHMRKHLANFGMSPADRAKVSAKKADAAATDPLSKIMGM